MLNIICPAIIPVIYSERMSHSYTLVFQCLFYSHSEQNIYIPFLSYLLNNIVSHNTSPGHDFNLFLSDDIFYWYGWISLRCNFETLSIICTKTNNRNGLYTQKKIKNGPGTISVAHVEVKLCTDDDYTSLSCALDTTPA